MPCIFGDVVGCLPEESFDPDTDFAQKFRDIDQARLNFRQYCHTCGRECSLFAGVQTDMEIAGLPCVDFSRVGAKCGKEGQAVA